MSLAACRSADCRYQQLRSLVSDTQVLPCLRRPGPHWVRIGSLSYPDRLSERSNSGPPSDAHHKTPCVSYQRCSEEQTTETCGNSASPHTNMTLVTRSLLERHKSDYSKVWSVRNRGLGFARLDFLSGLRNRAFARLDFLSAACGGATPFLCPQRSYIFHISPWVAPCNTCVFHISHRSSHTLGEIHCISYSQRRCGHVVS